jgi:hypothetical protein
MNLCNEPRSENAMMCREHGLEQRRITRQLVQEAFGLRDVPDCVNVNVSVRRSGDETTNKHAPRLAVPKDNNLARQRKS